jgi:hypothetical protein
MRTQCTEIYDDFTWRNANLVAATPALDDNVAWACATDDYVMFGLISFVYDVDVDRSWNNRRWGAIFDKRIRTDRRLGVDEFGRGISGPDFLIPNMVDWPDEMRKCEAAYRAHNGVNH